MDKNKHLDSVISTHQITKEVTLFDKYVKKKNEVKEALEDKYGSDIYSPFNSGSYAKNTAINTKFDFDLVSPFKRNAFGSNGTLKEMYEDVYDFLYEKYKDVAEVKKQKVSIGLEFYADSDGDVIKIDVVPGRELSQDQYEESENLNLYVYYKYGNIDAGSERIKTNVKAQINNIKTRATDEKDSIRKIIRLLKVWKNTKYNYPTKSFFLELITIKAFDNKTITGSIWEKLETVLEYIRDNVTKDSFTLKDPGNSSNDLADTLTSYEKQQLSDDMKNMLDRIRDNDENLKTYFPENSKFKKEESKTNQYGTNSGMPVPPPKLNFG
ncbi:nucleotidyltransferase [Elizabethkingia argentiflava]|uniref:Nucleotidyltransferase n=1 Tax=Elizabethkingia argenteiflava TaxID=2681556 RepID=A0A845PW18_9FLAO|nr:nucleotidyltransferase [Elizabethkingia argenteiflava]NAW51835.1 nucleotidyltransferase [Elizabethkingia argenteiflava]